MTAALPALEPVAAAAGVGAGEAEGPVAVTAPATAAAARVQQLQTLVAEVERGTVAGVGASAGVASAPAGSPTFAAALDAAQTGAGAAVQTTPAFDTAVPATAADEGAYPSLGLTAQATPGLDASPASAGAYADAVAPSTGSISPQASTYAPLIDQAAARYGLEPSLLAGLIQQESGFDPAARSGAGALGLTQLMPGTAASLGVTEPLDPAQAIEGGARYLSQLLAQFGGDTADALAAYNAGPGAVRQYGGVPPYAETQHYVADVLGDAASFRQSGLFGAAPAALYGAGGVPSPAAVTTAGEGVPA